MRARAPASRATLAAMGFVEWTVAGALVESRDGLLLVRNERRGGRTDWSTPGGVIDATDESLRHGLAREVEEETGLQVTEWEGPLYTVVARAPDLGWVMRCEVHRALAYQGELHVDDPDGIVVEAAFAARDACAALLARCAPWVREPLADWLADRWGPGEAREYAYEVFGTEHDRLRVVRS
jgi:8-oxo-dGTP diphosphatase